MMSRAVRLGAAASAAIGVVAVAAIQLAAQQRPIEDFFRDFSAEWARGNPNLAIQTRYFTGLEQERLERQMTPVSRTWREQRVDVARRGLGELRRMSRAGWTEQHQIAGDLLDWQLSLIVEGAAHEDVSSFPLEQFAGANVGLVNALTVVHPLRTEVDADNYLARLAQVSLRMEEAIGDARAQAARHILPPRFILRSTIAQMQQFIAPPPAENPFVTSLDQRLVAAKAVTDERRAALRAEAARIVEGHVYPAWRTAIALLNEQLAVATDAAGLWRLPGGPAAYAYQLRRHTTTSLTAEEIHRIGLREVARIEEQMDAILDKLGRTQGTVKERIEQLRKDLAYPLSEEGRTAIMADIEVMIRDSEKRAAAQFNIRPRAPVTAQPYPRFRENAAAASYSAPPLDGSRPGVFQMPLRPDQMTKFRLRSLVHHETVPGHHFQIALDLENTAQPQFRRVRLFGGIAALSEGWGLYAERIAVESGWYDSDPEGLLGALESELFRARRLVVDTGIHAFGWTREQAIEYGIEPSEVERYVVNPGQACAYMIGQLEIIELREKSRAALGDRFDIRDFHNHVLLAGTLPLDQLERRIDAYIRLRSAGTQ
jgi:uncharacterized protein (DUF885 family)